MNDIEKAKYYYNKADKAFFKKDYKLAKNNLEKVIKLNPNFEEAYSNLALLLVNNFQEYEKAKQYYEKAIELNPNFAAAYSNLALLLVNNFQEYEKAKQYYEKAIELNPNFAEAYNNYAFLLTTHFQEHSKAKQYYEKAIELDANYVIAYENYLKLLKKHFNENDSQKRKISFESSQLSDKINFIEINNFKIFKKIRIELTEHVNIILAQNGLGKTTFLQALTLANIPDENKINDFEIFLSFGTLQSNIIFNKNNKNISLIIDQYKKKTANKYEFSYLPIFLAYGVNIFTLYEKYSYDNIIDQLITGAKRNYEIKSIFSDFEDTFYDPLIILQKLLDKKTRYSSLINDFIIKKLNKLIPDYKIVINNNNIHYFVSENLEQNYLSTKNLSEGYRSAIILLTDIIIRVLSIGKKYTYDSLDLLFENITGVIAIDEFDRHLHPSWQRIYVNQLKKLLPNIQFVLTTHNPVAILGRQAGEVQKFYFDKSDKTLKIRKLPETESIDAGTILLKHFGLNSILSIDLQNKIDMYYKIKSKEKLNESDQKEIKILEAEITDSNVNVNIHDYRFLIFIKFMEAQGYDIRERLSEITLTKNEIEKLEKEFENYYN